MRLIARHACAGFLLTETLATFTISAFVLLGLVSASSELMHAVDRSVAIMQDVDDLSRSLAAIGRDVSSLSRARFDGIEPQPFIFLGGPNSLFFARREHGADGIDKTHIIALREIMSGSGTRLVRTDAILPPRATSFAALHFGPPRDLASGPARLRFTYFAPIKGSATQARLQKWPTGFRLPRAILIEAVDAASGRIIAAMRAPIHADADIGCIADGGASDVAPPLVPKTADLDFCALRQDAGPIAPATL
jgi:hypothetical protein